jgi:predicted nucleic acid-binding protein
VIVPDASVVFSSMMNDEEEGSWAADMIRRGELAAPHHLPAEVANSLRRTASMRPEMRATADSASDELTRLVVEYFPFAPFAARIWQLRHNVTPYDAWYVALAEALDAPLATLDRRLVRADGPRCEFLTP